MALVNGYIDEKVIIKMFKIGDKVIHSSYGLCEIAAIENANTYYGKQDCYVIYMQKTKIMVPVSHAEMLRYPIKKEEVPNVLEALGKLDELPDELSFKERIKVYTEKLVSNDILKIAEVLRSLAFLDTVDKLKGPEKNLLERIDKILSDEISFVQNISKQEAQRLIHNALKKIRGSAKCHRK
jgi:RNA polymerase-interacting CarD/CdnL/TRCF family regulator